MQSSNKDRTLISAAANLAGLFPPDKDQIWNDEIPNWLPIPIHTIPEELDHILASERPCPRYKEARKEQFTSHEFMANCNQAKEHMKTIEENSGLKNITCMQMFMVWDTLNAQISANLT